MDIHYGLNGIQYGYKKHIGDKFEKTETLHWFVGVLCWCVGIKI